MRTKDFRRTQARLKDLRRRKLYRNHAINGRYELSDKEDSSLSVLNNNPWYGPLHWSEVSVEPSQLDNYIGHWQEYPKIRNYGSKGYYRKLTGDKKIRQALKAKVNKELNDGT